MPNIKYTNSVQFRCLENLKETSIDLFLVHSGKEHCLPRHLFQGVRDEYIIHFVLDGKGSYSVGGNTWSLSRGQMFLIHPGEPVSYFADGEDPWYYCWIGFNGIRAEQAIKNCGFSSKKLVLPTLTPEKLLPYIDAILDARHLTFSNDLRRKAYLLELLATLADFHTADAPGKTAQKHDYSSNVYVEHAIEYIKFSYKRGINVSDIADYIGISRTYLNSSFQKEFGLSVQKFLIDYRMHKAANLLMSTTLTVNEISSEVGYEDPLTFSKAFKKKFEMSPKNYRDRKEQMDKFTEKQPS